MLSARRVMATVAAGAIPTRRVSQTSSLSAQRLWDPRKHEVADEHPGGRGLVAVEHLGLDVREVPDELGLPARVAGPVLRREPGPQRDGRDDLRRLTSRPEHRPSPDARDGTPRNSRWCVRRQRSREIPITPTPEASWPVPGPFPGGSGRASALGTDRPRTGPQTDSRNSSTRPDVVPA